MIFFRVERENEATGHDDGAMPNNVYRLKVHSLPTRQQPGLQQLAAEEELFLTNIWP